MTAPTAAGSLRQAFKRCIRRLGIDVVRYYPDTSPQSSRAALLKHFGVTLVLDVGANTGQYAMELRRHGYSGRIVSFEPLSSAHETLSKAASHDVKWSTVRSAVGDRIATAEIHVAGNSYSSSLLPMLEQHVRSAPESAYVGDEQVSVVTIDDIFPEYVLPGDVVFLKVDTQGYERQVLDGSQANLQRIAGIQIELSLVPLYADSMLYDEALDRITQAGYELCAIEPGFVDRATGRMLQCDGVFFRPR